LEVQIALARRDLEEAKKILKKLDQLAPNNSDNLPLRADLAEQTGNLDEARDYRREAVRRDPTWQNRLLLASFEARQGNIDEARKQIGAIDERSLTGWALENFGYFEMIYGDLEKAEEIYQKLRTGFTEERALSNLATVSALREDFEKAALFYKQALEANPNHIPTLINLAAVEVARGDEGAGKAHYEAALNLLNRSDNPGLTPGETLLKAQCHVRLGQNQDALDIVTDLSKKTDYDPQLLFQKALVLSLAGKNTDARAAAKGALERGFAPRWFTGPEWAWLRRDPDLRQWFPKGE
jgi:tetratricopeptide (TPR) repeat protein